MFLSSEDKDNLLSNGNTITVPKCYDLGVKIKKLGYSAFIIIKGCVHVFKNDNFI